MMGIHTHGMIIIIAIGRKLQAALQTPRRLSPVLQHHQQHQVELVRKQQVVVTHQLHQPVAVQLQMFITPHQVIVTIPQTVQTIHLHPVRQLV